MDISYIKQVVAIVLIVITTSSQAKSKEQPSIELSFDRIDGKGSKSCPYIGVSTFDIELHKADFIHQKGNVIMSLSRDGEIYRAIDRRSVSVLTDSLKMTVNIPSCAKSVRFYLVQS